MIGYSTLPIYLWDEAIKIAMHILNKIPTKVVQKTSQNYGLIENLV